MVFKYIIRLESSKISVLINISLNTKIGMSHEHMFGDDPV